MRNTANDAINADGLGQRSFGALPNQAGYGEGKFTWAGGFESHRSITAEQLQGLVIGLPWYRIGEQAVIRMA